VGVKNTLAGGREKHSSRGVKSILAGVVKNILAEGHGKHSCIGGVKNILAGG